MKIKNISQIIFSYNSNIIFKIVIKIINKKNLIFIKLILSKKIQILQQKY
jgi:hypothetical protein